MRNGIRPVALTPSLSVTQSGNKNEIGEQGGRTTRLGDQEGERHAWLIRRAIGIKENTILSVLMGFFVSVFDPLGI